MTLIDLTVSVLDSRTKHNDVIIFLKSMHMLTTNYYYELATFDGFVKSCIHVILKWLVALVYAVS